MALCGCENPVYSVRFKAQRALTSQNSNMFSVSMPKSFTLGWKTEKLGLECVDAARGLLTLKKFGTTYTIGGKSHKVFGDSSFLLKHTKFLIKKNIILV